MKDKRRINQKYARKSPLKNGMQEGKGVKDRKKATDKREAAKEESSDGIYRV